MKSKFSVIGRLTTGVSAAVMSLAVLAPAWAADKMGQPTSGGFMLQPSASEIRDKIEFFHNWILLPVIIGVALFVLALLVIVVVRFNKRSNPVPARWSHNTPIEILWTILPVLILMVIAIFSFRLLYDEHNMPPPYMTVKVTGRQWNWDYEYPDKKVAAYTSTILSDKEALANGEPPNLAVSAPMVVPVNQVVSVQVTAEDVIHSFSMPAFGVKIDAVPGRLNQTWFKANRTGMFYGQCSQLCGVDHAFMPIAIHVVTQSEFDAWVASKARKTPPPAAVPPAAVPAAAKPAPAAPPVAAAPAATPAAAAASKR